jgi:hypothetical protein
MRPSAAAQAHGLDAGPQSAGAAGQAVVKRPGSCASGEPMAEAVGRAALDGQQGCISGAHWRSAPSRRQRHLLRRKAAMPEPRLRALHAGGSADEAAAGPDNRRGRDRHARAPPSASPRIAPDLQSHEAVPRPTQNSTQLQARFQHQHRRGSRGRGPASAESAAANVACCTCTSQLRCKPPALCWCCGTRLHWRARSAATTCVASCTRRRRRQSEQESW